MKSIFSALTATILLTAGCVGSNDGTGDCGTAGIRLTITAPDEISAYLVTAAGDEGAINYFSCDTADGEDCPDVVVLPDLDGRIDLHVRAPGFRNLSETVNLSTSDMDAEKCINISVELEPLDGFEKTADYATGFSAGDGLDAFLALAVETTSTSGPLAVVKFYIDDLKGDPVVYFQNTKKHQLHFGFVRSVLGKQVTIEDYESSTYWGEDRTGMAGTLVYYAGFFVDSAQYGQIESPVSIEFFPSDNLTPQQALTAYDLVLERMQFLKPAGPVSRLAYVPATSDHQDAVGSSGLFERTGALWIDRESLFGSAQMQLMNRGTAYGRLLRLTPEDLEKTVVSWKDIVLLTRLPLEAPLVGGFITEEMQTPLAHVNVAAMNRGTPNMALQNASHDPRVEPFIYPGTDAAVAGGDGSGIVRYEVTRDGFTIEWATMEQAETFWQENMPTGLTVPEADTETDGLPDFADLEFEDSTLIGAKAANLAVCRQVLGDTVPDGFAVPFHYYQQFVEQAVVTVDLCRDARDDCIEEGREAAVCIPVCERCETDAGKTLESFIDNLLANQDFVSDSVFREAALDGLRYLFGHIPVNANFAALIDNRVAERFGTTGIRLRSSTNAEDLAEFSGAGLYESVGADSEFRPPSTRIGKVWGSVWNWRAFEERSYMGLEHTDVKMGVAVHRSFPAELANGVLITRNLLDPAYDGYYVNVQVGETSVTNPEDGSLPEIFVMTPVGSELKIVRSAWSTLSPKQPIMTITEMTALYVAARKLHNHFAGLYGANPSTFALDIEFKLDSPDRPLVIKQARPYKYNP